MGKKWSHQIAGHFNCPSFILKHKKMNNYNYTTHSANLQQFFFKEIIRTTAALKICSGQYVRNHCILHEDGRFWEKDVMFLLFLLKTIPLALLRSILRCPAVKVTFAIWKQIVHFCWVSNSHVCKIIWLHGRFECPIIIYCLPLGLTVSFKCSAIAWPLYWMTKLIQRVHSPTFHSKSHVALWLDWTCTSKGLGLLDSLVVIVVNL